MVQDQSKTRSTTGTNGGYSNRQPENKSANNGIEKMKMTSSTGSTFGNSKSMDQGKSNNSAAWGPYFKNRDHFTSMHFS